MKCALCDEIKKDENIIYQDDDIVVIFHPEPAVPGHCVVTTKSHVPIFEQAPDDLIEKLAAMSNKVSVTLFENMNIQGTNIIINNGVAAGQNIPHLMVNVIPRSENDGLDFTWEPKQIEEENLSTIELQFKEITENLLVTKEHQEQPEPVIEEQPDEAPKKEDSPPEEENYLIRQLRRIP